MNFSNSQKFNLPSFCGCAILYYHTIFTVLNEDDAASRNARVILSEAKDLTPAQNSIAPAKEVPT